MRMMHIHYDPEGDYLELRFGKPTTAYYEYLGDDVFRRRDERTRKVTGYAIFNVQKRKQRKAVDIRVPVPAAVSAS
jgi:uncharacterized protein YuzE